MWPTPQGWPGVWEPTASWVGRIPGYTGQGVESSLHGSMGNLIIQPQCCTLENYEKGMIWGTSDKMGYRYRNRIAHLQGCGGWAEGSLTELLVVFLRVADLFINHQLLSLTQSVGPGMFPPFGSYDGEELEDEGWVGWRVLGSVFSKTGDASMLPSAHRPSLPSFSHSLAREAETLDPHQYRPNGN